MSRPPDLTLNLWLDQTHFFTEVNQTGTGFGIAGELKEPLDQPGQLSGKWEELRKLLIATMEEWRNKHCHPERLNFLPPDERRAILQEIAAEPGGTDQEQSNKS